MTTVLPCVTAMLLLVSGSSIPPTVLSTTTEVNASNGLDNPEESPSGTLLSVNDDETIADSQSATSSVDVRIGSGYDDAEETEWGSIIVSSTDLELIYDGGDQTVGMRFASVTIPRGAYVTE